LRNSRACSFRESGSVARDSSKQRSGTASAPLLGAPTSACPFVRTRYCRTGKGRWPEPSPPFPVGSGLLVVLDLGELGVHHIIGGLAGSSGIRCRTALLACRSGGKQRLAGFFQ